MASIGPAILAHLLPTTAASDDDDAELGPQLPPSIGPAVPPPAAEKHEATGADDDDDDDDAYAPALPPDMLAAQAGPSRLAASKPPAGPVKGPSLPSAYADAATSRPTYDEDDSDDDVGPQPLRAGVGVREERDAVAEFMEKEERRRRQVEEAAQPKAVKRDEWMLVPPSSSALLGTLDPAKLSKGRQFSRGTVVERASGASTLWTETPAERQQRLADEVAGKKRRLANSSAGPSDSREEDLEARKRARVDAELRESVAEHTRRTRGAALVDMHTAAGKGSEKDGEPTAIWDRDRDMGVLYGQDWGVLLRRSCSHVLISCLALPQIQACWHLLTTERQNVLCAVVYAGSLRQRNTARFTRNLSSHSPAHIDVTIEDFVPGAMAPSPARGCKKWSAVHGMPAARSIERSATC
uniref:DUF3752 domain-containing protein n=1 Tax=Mycena chlorophos TaxID=658473 RepID=A0ABQ0LFP6_MYCCL|nr:predicted protein [Mycena chlorophos]